MKRLDFGLLSMIVLVCAGLLFTGCGKKGPPQPQDEKKRFAWESAEAVFTASGCLHITAVLTGAVENVEQFRLELEPEGTDICRECPFTPRETTELTPQQAVSGKKGTRYVFSYCPGTQADSYRWRLVGMNVFTAFAHALTPVKVVEAPPPSTL